MGPVPQQCGQRVWGCLSIVGMPIAGMPIAPMPHWTFDAAALTAIVAGGVTTLVLITGGVLQLSPWYLPRYLIPLAGMIYANAMNGISLAGERLEAEVNREIVYEEARKTALQASLIPITNSLFAVGLVSLPGMMTGQILSGVSPLIAVRYQIMVMCMIFGAVGLSSAIFLILVKPHFNRTQQC